MIRWVGVVALSILVLFLAYWMCFAFWMTAYYSSDEAVRTWQARFYMLFAAATLAFVGDVVLIVRLGRSRK